MGIPKGEPALLERRQHLRREQAEQLCGAPLVSDKKERALNPSQRVLLSLHHFGF